MRKQGKGIEHEVIDELLADGSIASEIDLNDYDVSILQTLANNTLVAAVEANGIEHDVVDDLLTDVVIDIQHFGRKFGEDQIQLLVNDALIQVVGGPTI